MNIILALCTIAFGLHNFVQGASVGKRETNAEKTTDKTVNIPRALFNGDEITVSGKTLSQRKSLIVNLVKGNANGTPDYDNIPCQIKMYFPTDNNSKDTVTISSIVNAKSTEELDEGSEPSQLFLDNTFIVTFKAHQDNKIGIYLKGSALRFDCRWTEEIKFLQVDGDVHKIEEINFILG